MWSADQLAHEAVRQEGRGQQAEARVTWGRAAEKAESVLVHHPHSRWADDALVLRGEALARSGACGLAAEPLRRALTTVADQTLWERAALAGAACLLAHGGARDVDHLLAPVLDSRDRARRSRAAYLAGTAALDRGDGLRAAQLFAQSARPEAGPARIRALLLAGRQPAAIGLIDSVARRTRDESEWAEVLNALSRAAGPALASTALDTLLRQGRWPAGARARLLITDGDRLRAAGLSARAAGRYAAARALVPDSVEGGLAQLRLVLAGTASLETSADLDSLATRLEPLTAELRGPAQEEAQSWRRVVDAIRGDDTAEIASFRAAELARDTLDAPALAAHLFLGFATRFPNSLFAPKALIAACQLHGLAPDSLELLLRSRYPASPYTLAYRGAASPAFQAAEESLAFALGVARPADLPARGRFDGPRTGPRGPLLDPPGNGAPAGGTPPARARPAVPGSESPRPPLEGMPGPRPPGSPGRPPGIP
jgi:hypothetical protein